METLIEMQDKARWFILGRMHGLSPQYWLDYYSNLYKGYGLRITKNGKTVKEIRT